MKIPGNLTPEFLQNNLSPYLATLARLQHTIDEIKGSQPSRVTIREISSDEDDNQLAKEIIERRLSATVLRHLREIEAIRLAGSMGPRVDKALDAIEEALSKIEISHSIGISGADETHLDEVARLSDYIEEIATKSAHLNAWAQTSRSFLSWELGDKTIPSLRELERYLELLSEQREIMNQIMQSLMVSRASSSLKSEDDEGNESERLPTHGGAK